MVKLLMQLVSVIALDPSAMAVSNDTIRTLNRV
ncbi:hypothetical protein swp_0515 [Shewanella piezotolerans WP3]|uniref:Uncharacterized protein n=1 Tax=Shewanella piezotolerans (strain WP3 / JCM 13877) TaxID=225849 RepID=B8CI67_SHEPW|nr:hypothetical protein swp_0515 [Shewanella piezotolerans WP3]